MGCLGVGLAALLALAVPASIARTSLIGAFVVLALLAALAVVAAFVAARRRTPAGTDAPRLPASLTYIGSLTVAYAVVVIAIHEVH